MAGFRPVYLPNSSQACHCSACVGAVAANVHPVSLMGGREREGKRESVRETEGKREGGERRRERVREREREREMERGVRR